LRHAAAAIDQLLAHASLGLHLTRPWKVVLAGAPNAGKSSLVNALVGYERSIVYAQPGTTRDAVGVETAVAGWPVRLVDTAGLRESTDPVERAGVAIARRQIAQADLTILVYDAADPRSIAASVTAAGATGDGQAADADPSLRLSDALLVANKIDLVAKGQRDALAGLPTSALAGDGIAGLLRAIGRRLVPAPPDRGAAVPFTTEQVDALRCAREHLRDRHVDQARIALRLGEM
jgi:tRNA modification GTPase